MSTTLHQKTRTTAGEHIRYLRNRAEKTQKDLADAIDVHYRTIANWESGQTAPNRAMYEKAIAALNQWLEEETTLLTGDDMDMTTVSESKVLSVAVRGEEIYRIVIVAQQSVKGGTVIDMG